MHVFDPLGRFQWADTGRGNKQRFAAFSAKHFYRFCAGVSIFGHADDRYAAAHLNVQVLPEARATAMGDIPIDNDLGEGDFDTLDKFQQAGEFPFVKFPGYICFYTPDDVDDRVDGEVVAVISENYSGGRCRDIFIIVHIECSNHQIRNPVREVFEMASLQLTR